MWTQKVRAVLIIASLLLFEWAKGVYQLPVVDLGYELHQALSYNETGQYYNFSNIRYGRAPTGELRFVEPQPPLSSRGSVNNGTRGGACPQAFAVWYLCGRALQSGAVNSTSQCGPSLIPSPDPLEQEDCLFLDVIVPKVIFDNPHGNSGAPVMVWIYGGGFAFGKKGDDGNPAGLIARSQELDPTGHGVVYVTLNYRGGAFGFLSGPNLQANGTANVGLLDQRLALDWVHTNIHLFGGDPDRVTVFGQSAGAGSVMHQITAYAGLRGPAPFQQAILQSPGFPLLPGPYQQDKLLQTFLGILNVSSVDEARRLPYEALYAANVEMVASSPYGTFTWAPAVDGIFVPALPGSLLLHGSYDTSVKVMTGFNAHETLYFTNPNSTNNTVFLEDLEATFPDAQQSVFKMIADTLYPALFNGSQEYDSYFTRQELALADAAFTCNTFYLQNAFRSSSASYGYRFSIPPAYHGLDVPYTYFNGPSESVMNTTIALSLQKYLVSFALSGQPNTQALVNLPVYGANATILDLNITGIAAIGDPNVNERCVWWQKGLYY